MKTLNKSILIYSDSQYKHAANFEQSLYNFPITLNYGEKHNRTKYILSCGNCDNITLLQEGIYIYVIGENSGLDYISMMVINTESKCIEGETFLHDDDINNSENISYNILQLNAEEQFKILIQYIY